MKSIQLVLKTQSLPGFIFHKPANISWVAKESGIRRLAERSISKACLWFLSTQNMHIEEASSTLSSQPLLTSAVAAVAVTSCLVTSSPGTTRPLRDLLCRCQTRGKGQKLIPPSSLPGSRQTAKLGGQFLFRGCNRRSCPCMPVPSKGYMTAPRSRSLQSALPTLTCFTASNDRCAGNPMDCLASSSGCHYKIERDAGKYDCAHFLSNDIVLSMLSRVLFMKTR